MPRMRCCRQPSILLIIAGLASKLELVGVPLELSEAHSNPQMQPSMYCMQLAKLRRAVFLLIVMKASSPLVEQTLGHEIPKYRQCSCQSTTESQKCCAQAPQNSPIHLHGLQLFWMLIRSWSCMDLHALSEISRHPNTGSCFGCNPCACHRQM